MELQGHNNKTLDNYVIRENDASIGWKEFVSTKNIEENDLLIFISEVQIFDPIQCEKLSAFFAMKCNLKNLKRMVRSLIDFGCFWHQDF